MGQNKYHTKRLKFRLIPKVKNRRTRGTKQNFCVAFILPHPVLQGAAEKRYAPKTKNPLGPPRENSGNRKDQANFSFNSCSTFLPHPVPFLTTTLYTIKYPTHFKFFVSENTLNLPSSTPSLTQTHPTNPSSLQPKKLTITGRADHVRCLSVSATTIRLPSSI
jgi:hypothetical protein